jgi:hypothetical protein
LENHVSYKWALKFLFEEMRRIDLLWKIVEYRASLLNWMFNVYEFCCFKTLSQQVVSYYISIQFFWCKYRGEYLPPFKTKPTIVILII